MKLLPMIVLFTTHSLVFCNKNREKRYMIFPETAPTRHQFIAGMGIPLHSEVQSVTTGYVFKAVYSLPIKADDWRPYFFLNNNKIRRDVSSSMSDNNSSHLLIDHLTGQKYEHFDVEAKEIERKLIDNDEEENDEDDEDDDEPEENDGNFYWNANQPLPKDKQPLPVNSRWNFYKGLEAIGDNRGVIGRSCILRSICESASASFNHKSGLLGELLHIILTPSSTSEDTYQHTDNEYFRAEKIGKSGAPCELVFKDCPSSVLDTFTGITSAFNFL